MNLGIQQREFHGIPATNKKFETVGVIIFRFADGQIKEGWSIVDDLTASNRSRTFQNRL